MNYEAGLICLSDLTLLDETQHLLSELNWESVDLITYPQHTHIPLETKTVWSAVMLSKSHILESYNCNDRGYCG